MKRTPLQRKSRLKRGKQLVKSNRKRRAKRFETDFGGKEFLALIHSLPCSICGVVGYSVAAHLKSRGAGGKADVIAPLCSTRLDFAGVFIGYGRWTTHVGCHERYDAHDPEIRKHESRLKSEAKSRWQAFQATLTERNTEQNA